MFLGFLTVAAYYWYVRKGGLIRYTFVLFVFALGLMAKPLLVTLPCVLLLLDYWPLQRLAGGLGRVSKMSPGTQSPKLRRGSRSAGFMILEKVPLLILSAVSSVLTIWCQQSAGVVASTDTLSLPVRVLNALAVYTIYLRKIVWPSDLGVFYPHPGFVTLDPYAELLLQALAGTILLLAVTIWACLRVRQYPYLAVGWFWYLGTLFPMIGLLQVGEQQMADRYVYFPLVGLMIATAWLVPAIVPTRFHRRYLLRYAGVLAIVICTIFSWKQIAYWQNSVTLFEHTLAVTEHNSWAHNNLGLALHQGGKSFEARVQFREALKIDPKYALAYYNLGVVWHDLGRSDRAIPRFEEALRRRPGYVDAHLRLGIALADMEHFEDAILHFQQAVKLAPENLAAHFNLGLILLERGQQERAVRHFREALRIEPHYTEAQKNLQKALAP
jgi:tetratricopeptide (TPR) repeat protein